MSDSKVTWITPAFTIQTLLCLIDKIYSTFKSFLSQNINIDKSIIRIVYETSIGINCQKNKLQLFPDFRVTVISKALKFFDLLVKLWLE